MSDVTIQDYRRDGLRVIDGNPLAIRENSDRSLPCLSLVWNEEGTLVAKKTKKVVSDPLQGSLWWRWLVTHGEGVAIFLTLIGVVLWVTWHLSKYDSRLENLEKTMSGGGGLTEQVRDLREDVAEIKEDVAGIKATVHSLDRHFLSQQKDRAAQLLGTPNVYIYRTQVQSNEGACSPSGDSGSDSGSLSQREIVFTYCIVGVRDNAVTVRAQMEEVVGGKIVRNFGDKLMSLPLPTQVEERVSYYIKPDNIKLVDGKTVSFPGIHYEFVLLERYGPNELTIASATKTEGTS